MNAALPIRSTFALLALATAGSAQVTWTTLAGTGAPIAFNGHCWDSARNRLVAFGGELAAVFSDTTTEWTGSQWMVLNPAVRPSARTRPAMVYDEGNQQTVLFGGFLGPGSFSNQTWRWNGTTWSLASPASSPSVRSGSAMAFDSARQVVVLFGGFVPSGADVGDTWEWNGSTWTQRFPAGATPLARGAHRMAYDAARGVTVLCGGYTTPGGATLSDTWTWDGTSWTQRPSLPGTLCDQVFAYDTGRRRVVLWGGVRILGPTFTDLNQTFEWDGAAWTPRSPLVVPNARNSTASAYDTGNHRVLMAGGTTSMAAAFADTLAYRPVNAGSATPFGNGCPTTGGPVQLDAPSLPYAGSSFVHEIGNAPAAAVIGLIAYGLSNTNWNGVPLPVDLAVAGAPGCFLLISPDVTAVTLLTNGTGTVTWDIPNQPALVSQQFFTQAIVLDPNSPLAFQIGVSSGRACVIGAL
ncbi:MAG TPA: kelch repeat-containing protein [Planctomycetota bacterium]|nr:kelch repeat-containing protein [Planctomycetota bacterium]